ncbi:MAG: SRPBCC family protein [Acidimicrobiales bacterium]
MRSLATLIQADGSWTLRFERRFDHPIEKVWRAVIEPEHRDSWFPQRIVGDLERGATVRFVDDPNIPAEGFEGRVLAVDPPRLLELEWGGDRLRIELDPDGEGTRFVLLDTLDERRHAARSGAGWHLCLEGLHADLDGRPAPPETDEAIWNEVHGAYLEAVGGDRHVWGEVPA